MTLPFPVLPVLSTPTAHETPIDAPVVCRPADPCSSAPCLWSSIHKQRLLNTPACATLATTAEGVDTARTNIDLDDRLVEEGLRVFKCKTKKELIHLALQELLKTEKRKEILKLRGRLQWEGDLEETRRSRL
jgi:Arc/MetJ family transcription regulator